MNKIFPRVMSYKNLIGDFTVRENCKYKVFLNDNKVNAFRKAWFIKPWEEAETIDEADIVFKYDGGLTAEAYRIESEKGKIKISFNDASGAFYAVSSLKELLQRPPEHDFIIEDKPALSVRGLMIDISRNKVPSMQTLKQIVDLMADLKMNHLELYVEGFSFEYRSFPAYLKEDGFLTVDEYRELEAYARERFIDLVPNQNGFGHMSAWLEKPEFKHLAVCPDGIELWGRHRNPSTLNPLDPESLQLVRKMYADMLPYSQSSYFNMNFDEPFELGYGAEGIDIGETYLSFLCSAAEEVKKYGKTPLVWGDVLLRHPEVWDKLPKEMIFIDWGYDASYPFSRHAKELDGKGIKFICAPGTTSWTSFCGRFLDWTENIANAVDAALCFGGIGILLTDWGDYGHLQFLPFSFAPIVFAGMYSWSHREGTLQDVRCYLNERLFRDGKRVIGDLLLDLSNYYRYDREYRVNGTNTFYTFIEAKHAIKSAASHPETAVALFKKKIPPEKIIAREQFMISEGFLNLKSEELKYTEADQTVIDEIAQTIKILKMIKRLSLAYNEEEKIKTRIDYLKEVRAAKDDFIAEQKRLWLLRNKRSGLDDSIEYLESFFTFVTQTLRFLEKKEQSNEK